MRLPDSLSAADFLDRHWQKRPLFMPGAFDRISPALPAEELAWLATQEDVESRLVFTETRRGATRYRLEEGPFDEHGLAALPESGWTLLVQDVDKHLPAFRELLTSVPFIPDWRLDDLMVSFAAPGGGVGPHQDNYDVFLCQGSGTREWRLSNKHAVTRVHDGSGLRLLKPFDGNPRFQCVEGDVLYLPPGVPHWGMTTTPSLTYSIGLRAPDATELRLAMERLYPGASFPPGTGVQPFYTDPDLGVDESSPGCISEQAINRARLCFPFAGELPRAEFAIAFGCAVTDPKAWLAPEGLPGNLKRDILARKSGPPVTVHGMAKLAWCEVQGRNYVFVNGLHTTVGKSELGHFQRLCRDRQLDAALVSELFTASAVPALQEFLDFLLEQGAFDAESLNLHG